MSKVDLAAFRFQPDGTFVQALVDNTTAGETISGAGKLAQRFVLILMTPKGSIPYQTNRGSQFLARLQNGGIATDRDVFVAFASVQGDIIAQLKSMETTTSPASEKFSKATLNSLTVTFGSVLMNMTLTSQDGTATKITWPLAFNLQ